MGNNGIWALEKHPMEFLYGYSVAAELRPETPYHEVVEALGGHGSVVREPGELRGALEAAFRVRQAGARQRADRPVDSRTPGARTSLNVRKPPSRAAFLRGPRQDGQGYVP